MKIFLDTNVLISAFVFGGNIRKQLVELLDSKHEVCVSKYVDEEFRKKLFDKWNDIAEAVYSLYRKMDFVFYDSIDENLCSLRDKKDEPVLSDAIFYHADVLLTGDKDLLVANVERPVIISLALFNQFCQFLK